MSVRIGDVAPNFTAETTHGSLDFHQWLGNSWAILFSHPRDFTPVCTTELGAVAKMQEEFDKRGCKPIAVSVDSLESHLLWIKDINETQHTEVNFPLIADPDRKVATLYDMIHPNASDTMTVRSVFVIGPDKKVRLTMTYPASAGRNFEEILRALDAVQLTDHHSVATPANWYDGEDCVILPTVTDDEAKARFPSGWNEVKAYLRVVPQPKIISRG